MADIDKLVKVGQLDTIVDEIVGKFSESNDRTRWYSLTANVTDGSYVVGSTGGIGTNANLSYTEVSMLPFRGKGITIQSYLWQGAGYAFLDENGAYITGESANTKGITPAAGVVTKIETSVPYNAYVLRVSLHRNTYSAKAKKYFFTIGESKATKVVFIGDSYGTGYNTGGSTTGWVPGAASALGLKSSDFEKQAKGGAGFRHPANTSPNETFTDLLNTATLAKEDVGRIIVCGGYNDHIYTVIQLLESFGTFATKAREKYPFAEICVGMIGHTSDTSVQETIMNTTRQAYMQMANVPGVRYLSNVECTLTDENVASDHVHPNQAGATALGTAVGNAVKTGSTSGKVYDSEIAGINGRLAQVTDAIGTTTVHTETVDDNVTEGIVYRKNGGQIEHANALSIKHTVADGETSCKFSGYTWSNTNVAALIAFDANMSMLDYYGETVGKYENIEYTYPTGTKTIVVNGITSPALMPLLTVYSTTEEITDVGERFERIEETTIDALKSLNIACDGDSTTGEGAQEDRKSWFSYALAQTGYGTRKNVGCGNAFAKDRSSNTSGTAYYPQWKPSVGSAWVDYYGLSDPNYAGSEGTYVSGTAEFDQATANNCLYSHIGYYVDGVNNNLWPAPDVFIIAMNGTNDLWRDTEQRTINALGTFEDAIVGDWSALTRDNVLKSIRWAVQFMRSTYPNCLIFFKTATQKCKETHPYFYIAEEPILKLCKYLSVPVIDSYGELGINAEFEHRPANNNQWTSDGVHPTDAGYKKEGRFVAKVLLNNYRPNA